MEAAAAYDLRAAGVVGVVVCSPRVAAADGGSSAGGGGRISGSRRILLGAVADEPPARVASRPHGRWAATRRRSILLPVRLDKWN